MTSEQKRNPVRLWTLIVLGLCIILMMIYLAGDPSLSMLEVFSDTKEFIVAAVLAVIMVPWVVSQIEN
jgi:hypothetical protein